VQRTKRPPKPGLDALWREGEGVVRAWIVRWALKSGRDERDLWDPAVDAFLRAADTWDPEGPAAWRTWLTGGLRNRLRWWSQKEMRAPEAVPVEEGTLRTNGEAAFAFDLAGLGNDARLVVEAALWDCDGFAYVNRYAKERLGPARKCRAFAEIREMLAGEDE
jgi:hypothetical protein